MNYSIWILREKARKVLEAEYSYKALQREGEMLFYAPYDEYHDAALDWNERMKLLRQKWEFHKHTLKCLCSLVKADEKTVIAVEKSINRRTKRPRNWTRFPDIRPDQEESYRRHVASKKS